MRFNHPNFRYANTGNTPFGLGTFPTELTGDELSALLHSPSLRRSTIPGRPLMENRQRLPRPARHCFPRIRGNVNATRSSNGIGGLPADFFHVQLPQGFATTNPLSFDITNLQGYKLYRLRQTYDTNFGTLTRERPGKLSAICPVRNQDLLLNKIRNSDHWFDTVFFNHKGQRLLPLPFAVPVSGISTLPYLFPAFQNDPPPAGLKLTINSSVTGPLTRAPTERPHDSQG